MIRLEFETIRRKMSALTEIEAAIHALPEDTFFDYNTSFHAKLEYGGFFLHAQAAEREQFNKVMAAINEALLPYGDKSTWNERYNAECAWWEATKHTDNLELKIYACYEAPLEENLEQAA